MYKIPFLNLNIGFDNPYWIWILAVYVALVIFMWVMSYKSLSGLGPNRRLFARCHRGSARICTSGSSRSSLRPR